ncbi:stage II sporulation protein M [uncultured Methanomethylovorans sp.]|uniref:stage II sporulation protein M n=1 Tax=uncultured Methanomethylovorans sp. TaxID=183759 RepID=UPI00374988E0
MINMYNVSNKEQALQYIKDIRREIWFISILFVLSMAIGYVVAIMYPGMVMQSLEELEGVVELLKNLSPIQIMFLIFLNNALKSLLILVLGIGFGIVPLLFIAYNGYFLGIFSHKILMEQSLLYLMGGLLPHGIIEIPMVVISAAIGIRLGLKGLASLKGEQVDLKEELITGIKFFFYWIMPLLFIAAVVETFITSAIIGVLSQL